MHQPRSLPLYGFYDTRHTMKNNRIRVLLIMITILLNLGCDQSTKYLAREELKGEDPIHVVGDLFILVYAENEGAFLGFGSSLPSFLRTVAFRLIPVIFLLAFLYYIIRNTQFTLAESLFSAFIIGGGVGNLLDRLRFDGVVSDFMHFGVGSIRTGILNMADLSITLGVIGLLVTYIIAARPRHRHEQP